MTISSTWIFEASSKLIGCGVDAESIERFRSSRDLTFDPWDQIFTSREVAHNRALPDPAFGFCASFCAKEAVLKALGEQIDYRDCELLVEPGRVHQQLLLDDGLRHDAGISEAFVMFDEDPGAGEIVISVILVSEEEQSGRR